MVNGGVQVGGAWLRVLRGVSVLLATCLTGPGVPLWAEAKAEKEARDVGRPAPDPATDPATGDWAFKDLRQDVPASLDDPWVVTPIDAFILDALREKRLEPSSPAHAPQLIRRLHLVLHGVPPTPEAVERFVKDSSPLAYEDLVNAALESPRYGERWTQHWLDVIRFAETTGYEVNKFRKRAFPFRDWVVRALNEDMPYDRFVFEQLAGDTVGVDAATGFLVAGPANLSGQIGENIEARREARQDELDEIIKATGQAFLGLTAGCARCHDHKFDPIAQKDYYALQAVFAGVYYGERRLRGAENDRWTAQLPDLEESVAALRDRAEKTRQRWNLRPAVESSRTEERFEPVNTRAVRMEIASMNSADTSPALFEFQIWTVERPGEPAENVALASRGGRASASSFALVNQTRHPEQLINGKNKFPWAAAEKGPAWLQIDLPQTHAIDKISWLGAHGSYPVDYDIRVLREDGEWVGVAHSRDRVPGVEDRRDPEKLRLPGVPAAEARALMELLAELRTKSAEHRRLAAGPQVYAGSFREPRPTYLLHRGDAMRREGTVAPDILKVLGSLALDEDAAEPARRVALARHLTGPAAPQTARVMVNRIWQHHFGVGIVDTPSDFGRMGARPTHPELLDWLASQFISSGWSLKHIHRLILLSSTFRQRSEPRSAPGLVDSDTRYLWRFPPRRLDAEALRDSILQTSGKLNLQMYGPGFDFFDKRGGVEALTPRPADGPAQWRRMIYATKIRMETGHVFGAFDCPDAGQMAPRRSRSITPVQALNLFNSDFVTAQADEFAQRVRREAGPGSNRQVSRAVVLALGRPPDVSELLQLSELSRTHGLEQVCRVLLNTNEFVFLQ